MKQLSPEQKYKILAYFDLKYSGSYISKLLGIPKSTVNRIIATFKKSKTVERVKGSGRVKKLTGTDQTLILDKINKNLKISLRKSQKT